MNKLLFHWFDNLSLRVNSWNLLDEINHKKICALIPVDQPALEPKVTEGEGRHLVDVLYSWWSTYDFSEIHKENYEKIKNIILSHAALAGPSEEERKEIWGFVESRFIEHGWKWNKKIYAPKKDIYEKAKALVLGRAAQEGEKEKP
jgi:hypothetical protein